MAAGVNLARVSERRAVPAADTSECFMEIMKLAPFLPVVFGLFFPLVFAANPDVSSADSGKVTGAAIIAEINLARQNPTSYAIFLEQTRQNYTSRLGKQPDAHALDEAIRFLRRARPLPALALSPGLCLAAADHCREQASGAVGHHGRGGSNPGSRISRYGVVAQGWAENIAYGQHFARAIVTALIIDNGVRSRGHRRNIFSPNYHAAGAACGPHARYGSVCSIDFANGYSEGTMARIRFNDATPTTGRGVADPALFRVSVAPMDRP
jgi:uncharacterized protein YkwD